ncbi:hypothetical protein HPP92_018009 [Vanilla planifolia]|nr:hypothetical protein HPP92_018009 [Vanilla planifolia]
MKSNNAEKENVENEDIEDEEESDLEEEDIDGYESPPMGGEDDLPPYGAIYDMGESIPNEYLQELLSEFPWIDKGKAKQSNEEDARGVGSSDGEYQIYEQDSEEEDDFL